MNKSVFPLLVILLMFGVYSSHAASVSVTGIQIEHNVVKNDIIGLDVVLNFSVSECIPKQAVVEVILFNKEGKPIFAPNSSFDEIGEGFVSVRNFIQPLYETSYFNNYRVFIPYAAMANSGSGSYFVRASFWVYETEGSNMARFVTNSPVANFAYNNAPSQTTNKQNVDVLQQVLDNLLNPTFKFDFSNLPSTPTTPVQSAPSTSSNQRERCLGCHGSGRIEKHLYTPGGGFFYCTECHRERPNGHYHDNCPGCHGTGWIGSGF